MLLHLSQNNYLFFALICSSDFFKKIDKKIDLFKAYFYLMITMKRVVCTIYLFYFVENLS